MKSKILNLFKYLARSAPKILVQFNYIYKNLLNEIDLMGQFLNFLNNDLSLPMSEHPIT